MESRKHQVMDSLKETFLIWQTLGRHEGGLHLHIPIRRLRTTASEKPTQQIAIFIKQLKDCYEILSKTHPKETMSLLGLLV